MSVERFVYCPDCHWEGVNESSCPECGTELKHGGTVIY